MVDCRSLIEFCRAFEQHRNMTDSQASVERLDGQSTRRSKPLNPLSHPFCEHSAFAAIDQVLLVLLLVALSVLALPYFKFIFRESCEQLPGPIDVMADVVYQAPIAYAAGLAFVLFTVIVVWEFFSNQVRKCGNPYCNDLRNATEFDIDLDACHNYQMMLLGFALWTWDKITKNLKLS